MKILRKIFLPIFILSTAVILLLTPLLYYAFNVDFYTAKVENQDPAIVQDVYSFLRGEDSLSNLFTDNEKSHMYDVKAIFNVVFVIEIVVFILFFLLLLFYVSNKQKSDIIWGLLLGSGLIILFVVLLFFALTIDFEAIFTIFHKLFFPQGNWVFPSSSALIKIFPGYFFEEIIMRIILVNFVFSFLVFGSNLYLKKSYKI